MGMEVGDGSMAQEARSEEEGARVKDWSEFNAKFGAQRCGSFSDFLVNEGEAAPASSGAPELGSDVDFFEWGGLASEPAAVVGEKPPVEEAPPVLHEEVLPVDGVVVAPVTDGAGEVAVVESADPYPGWFYDYQAGEWRQVEGYSAVPAAAENAAGHSGDADHGQTIAEVSGVQAEESQGQDGDAATWDSPQSAASQAWDSAEAAATQTVADEYPGWTWDYAAQAWVATPGYSEGVSEGQSQAFSGQESWYGQQEQQTQTYGTESSGVSQNVEPSQQPQSFYGAGDGANALANGYPADPVSAYSQGGQQWQGQGAQSNASAGVASSFYSPQVNGDGSWAGPGYGGQGHFGGQTEADAYYQTYGAAGVANNYLQQQQQQQQGWGNAPQYNQYQQYTNPTAPPPKNVQEAMRTSVGRPPHSLAAFGFGGKFLFMKHRDPVTLHTSDGDQAFASGVAWMPGPIQVSNLRALVPQESSFVGPLTGGGSTKELNKWIDERVATLSARDPARLLLGVLKVACQHYGKLRSSNVNSANSAMEEDGPEAALAKLLAGGGDEQGLYGGLSNRSLALRGAPVEQQLQATAVEVKKLLVCGKRKDALKCAQEGELWGIALVIARQLGEKFFCDTVTEMARRQFVSGSPLRTLSLLLAGQPAEVFAASSFQPGSPVAAVDQNQDGQGAMLDDWQENLAIMAANRTQGDERVMLHLGDRLWGVRGEVAAAHLCYLVADANLELYSGNARLCLIGADHVKNPRTFVTAKAIQRTEVYEYAKVLGNPQSVILSFQPYKVVYAEMLLECGNTKDSLKYCRAVLQTLKSAGVRSPEVEHCKALATSLEERIRLHLQDGSGSKLAPGKLVNKIKGTMDWGISKLIGGPPPTAPATDSFGSRPSDNGDHFGSRPGHSGGQRSGAFMPPSASIATSMERLPQEPNRGPARSQSTPDFGWNSKQGDANGQSSPRPAGLLRLGSNLLSRASGLWGTPKNEAKLGDTNKFYYDEKLKKWVEEGVDPTPEVAPLPPPPTTSSFVGSIPASQDKGNAPAQAVPSKPGTPPLAPSSTNYYSNRRQGGGVRSRYVDTFNKGGLTTPTKSVMGSLLPPTMPGGGMVSAPAMFVPGPAPSSSFAVESSGDVGESFGGVASRSGDTGSGQGPMSDPGSSHSLNDAGVGYDSSMVAGVSGGLASFKAEGDDQSSHGGGGALGGAHAKTSSWGGYPSSFQNPVGEEDFFGASFSGHDRASGLDHAAAMSPAQPGYGSFYLPNGSDTSASLPPPPALGAFPMTSGESRDPSRQYMGQQFRVSQSVDSLSGEEMQEVEL